MKLLERFLVNTGEIVAAPYLKTINEKSLENIVRNSLKFLDPDSAGEVQKYLRSCVTEAGGFCDRGSNPDLYYTLFGYFIAKALDVNDLLPGIFRFTQEKIRTGSLSEVHLHCAAIISSNTTPSGYPHPDGVVKKAIRNQIRQKKIYNAFLSLITCYYIKDYPGIYTIRKYLGSIPLNSDMPCTLSAAMLVLQKTFNRPYGELLKHLLSYYNNNGGFIATKRTKTADLLSTAVALYAMNFTGADMRMIRPVCLDYIDSLYNHGGFSANSFDPETDIEYTFYGLLALGALSI